MVPTSVKHPSLDWPATSCRCVFARPAGPSLAPAFRHCAFRSGQCLALFEFLLEGGGPRAAGAMGRGWVGSPRWARIR
jgi:hypothetical protein